MECIRVNTGKQERKISGYFKPKLRNFPPMASAGFLSGILYQAIFLFGKPNGKVVRKYPEKKRVFVDF